MWINDTGKRLYLTSNQQEVVGEDDIRAAFLLVGVGGQLTEAEARRWGLLNDEKAKAPPPNKSKDAPANKGKA